MNRRAQVLFAAGAIPIAAVIAIVDIFIPRTSWVIGAGFLVLTVVLLVWQRQLLRPYRRDGVVLFSRGPWTVIIGLLLVEAVSALDLIVAPSDVDRVWIALGYFLSIIFYLAFLPSMLLFWAADHDALRSQLLTSKRALPWAEIDWLYMQSSETTYKQMHISLARWRDEQLNVEAGPQRTMQVLVRTPLAGGAASPLLTVIRARATHAVFGIDQLPAVLARRRGPAPAIVAPSEPPNLTLPDVIELARKPTLPANWTRFPVSQRVIWPNIVIYAVLAVASIGAGVFLLASNTIVGLDLIPQSWLTGSTRTLVLLGEVALFGLFAIVLCFISLRWQRTLRHPQDYFFLVTPRFIAEVHGRKFDGVAVSNVLDVNRTGGGIYGGQIELAMRSGRKRQFDVGNNYGPQRDLFAYILAAVNARRPVQVGAPSPFGATMPTDAEA